MAKTLFVNGTIVQPPFLNGVFAHVHDGADSDGHASKINLDGAAHVTGRLPVANVADISATTVIDNSQFNQTTVAGALNTVKSSLDALAADKTELSGTMQLVGFAENINVNFYAQIHRHRTPQSVLTEAVLYLPEILGLSTTTYLQILSSSIPAALRPTYKVYHYASCVVANDHGGAGGWFPGIVLIIDTGDWLFRSLGGAFAQTNNKGIARQFIRYMIDYDPV